ncbi:MAG: hypothetical protein ACU0CA_10185 [Paracoccaceae bacterium]
MRATLQTALFFALTASALFMLRAEVSAFSSVQTPDTGPVRYIENLPDPAFSLKAAHRVLFACDVVMAVPLVGLQPQSRRKTTARVCGSFAAQVIAVMPGHGFAHLIAARATDDRAVRDGYLATSAQLAPFEGWQAERRFVFGANAGALDQQALRQDAATLLTTQSGAELLSRYYLRRRETQFPISTAVDQASAKDQQRFLNFLITGRAAR